MIIDLFYLFTKFNFVIQAIYRKIRVMVILPVTSRA